jgi:hypothetical protein
LLAFACHCISGFVSARATVIATSPTTTSTTVTPAFTRFAWLAIGILWLVTLVVRALLVTAFCTGFSVAFCVLTPFTAAPLAWSALTALATWFVTITARAPLRALFLAFGGSGLHANVHVMWFAFGVKTLALRAPLALAALVATTSTAATAFTTTIAAIASFWARFCVHDHHDHRVRRHGFRVCHPALPRVWPLAWVQWPRARHQTGS